MAEEWGIAPWALEAELSALWRDRWAALQQARAAAREDAERRSNSSTGGRKRLI